MFFFMALGVSAVYYPSVYLGWRKASALSTEMILLNSLGIILSMTCVEYLTRNGWIKLNR